jgi:hypothetical protein
LFIGKLRQCRFVDGRAWGRLLFDLMTGILILMFALLTAAGGSQAAPGSAAAAGTASFPRLMGMNIGAKNYDDATYQKELARLNVIILGFHKGWNPGSYGANSAAAMRKAVQAIKSHNPNDPATLDLRDKLYASHWWLLNAAGRKVQWTSQYSTWEINFTDWTRPDADGRRWPDWLAERYYTVYFRDIPEFDIVFLDGVNTPLRVTADWDLDKVDDNRNSPIILAAHYAGHLAHWNRLRELAPNALLVGNADNDLANAQWRNQLNGGFLEGMMGERWSIERWAGWGAMMKRYRAVLQNTRQPKIVGFNVVGAVDDYRFFRYAYTSCLLDDGYFSFTDKSRGYSSVAWFDEYDYKLGNALSAPPNAAWDDGIWRRDFQNGVVLVNPTIETRTVNVEPGLRRLAGKQDPVANNGSAVGRLTLQPKDGIVLRR